MASGFWKSVAAGALAVAAVAGGLGVSRGRAAPALPTAFELSHGRILSVVGVHSASVAFGRTRRIRDSYGGTYTYFQTLGGGTLTLEVTDQRGARATIGAMSVEGTSYGGGYKDDATPRAAKSGADALAPGRRATARLRHRQVRMSSYYGTELVDKFRWTSVTALRGGTRVILDGTATAGSYDGEFQFGGKSGVAGGAAKAMTGKRAAKMRGFDLAAGGGLVQADVAWTGEDRGTVTFTEPAFLAGKSGAIRRLPSGVFQVTGPAGHGVRMRFDEDGAGSCTLGLGTFRVPGSDDGGFRLQYE